MKCCGVFCKQAWYSVKTKICRSRDTIEFSKKWECKICGCVKKVIYKQYNVKEQKEVLRDTYKTKRELTNYKDREQDFILLNQTGPVEYNFILNYFDRGEEKPCRESFSSICRSPKYKPISYEEENQQKFFRQSA